MCLKLIHPIPTFFTALKIITSMHYLIDFAMDGCIKRYMPLPVEISGVQMKFSVSAENKKCRIS